MKNQIRYLITGILIFLLSGLAGQSLDTLRDDEGSLPKIKPSRAPVILLNDTLFYIHQPIGIYSSQERAKRLNLILDGILKEGTVEADSFNIVSSDENHFIIYKGLPLMAVYPIDTTGTGVSPVSLARMNMEALQKGFSKNLTAYNLKSITKNILYAGIITVLVVLVVFLLNWIFRRIFRYMENRKERYFKGWHIRGYPVLAPEQQFKFMRTLLVIFKFGLIIFLIFIALPIIFTLFPATEGFTRKLIGLIWNPVNKILMGIIRYIPNLITIVVIYIVFRWLIRGIRFLTDEISSKKLEIPGFYPEWAQPTLMIIRFVMYIFMFIIIFPFLPGSDSEIFKGVSVFVGLLISIGSSSAISNAVAGLVITYMRPFKIGDKIKIDDIVGTVLEKSALVTRIRTIKNEDVTIPNSKILTSHTVNYSEPARETGLIIHTTVTIGYDAPWRKVHQLLTEAALNTPGVLKDPSPFVLQTSLDDFYISYQLNVYIREANNMLKIRSELHQNIQDAFNRGGVEIMSPHYRAERDGNEVTIPKNWEEEFLPSPAAIPPVSTAPKKRGRKPRDRS